MSAGVDIPPEPRPAGSGSAGEEGARPTPGTVRPTATPSQATRRPGSSLPAKALTIGAVCKQLEREFPDISISKIRYLEDQKLLSPRRTPGGYRLYSAREVNRLRTILRLQRDEFLPLRVIRQELAAGRADAGASESQAPDPRTLRRATVSVGERTEARYTLANVLEETGAEASLVRELEDFGVIKGRHEEGELTYDETEREIVRAAAELARFGVGGRNLRVFRTSADREAALLEQILAPSLRSRNPERRREAVETLENLATIASHLKHLLLVRDLRRLAPG
ncbi:MAG: MerR family transcriptional regulator [Actinomycetota bacterium]|jgi:DNA-binding transcriptional MerR regulator|nr:MerR family transcriptional regulator [Actinomycetota bacterium]MDQ3355828.1 MerR family transcriptional regulator [Actinomycetota bacterium]